jgi:hypothetical protein
MQSEPKPIRNLFLTTTAIGIYLTLCGVFVSAAPNIRSLLSRNQAPDKQADIADVIAIATGLVGATGALIGRYNAGGVYTPNGLPGKDKIPTLPPDINN